MAELDDLFHGVSPLYEQSIYDSIIGGWVDGATEAVGSLPAEFLPPEPLFPPAAPPTPPGAAVFWPDDEPPVVRLVSIDNAVDLLRERRIVEPADFYALSTEARKQAFTITADLTAATLERIRDRLADVVEQGPSLRAFRDALVEDFDTLPLGAAHLEQVYRNNVNEAFSQGMETILDHPVVDDGFPYRMYVAVHDARARKEHRALETRGIDGTAVYYKSDPTWLKFRPPWDFGCRCGWIALSVESAAEQGVREAQEWLRTGVEPPHPPVPKPPFSPSPSWDRAAQGVLV